MSGIALSFTYGFSPTQVIKRNKGAEIPTADRCWCSRPACSLPPGGSCGGRPVDIGERLPAFEATALSGEAFSLERDPGPQGGRRALHLDGVLRTISLRRARASETYGRVRAVRRVTAHWESRRYRPRASALPFPMIKDERHAIAERSGPTAPEAFSSTPRATALPGLGESSRIPDLQRAIDAVLEAASAPAVRGLGAPSIDTEPRAARAAYNPGVSHLPRPGRRASEPSSGDSAGPSLTIPMWNPPRRAATRWSGASSATSGSRKRSAQAVWASSTRPRICACSGLWH